MSFHSYLRECKMGQWADIPRSKCLPGLDTAVTEAYSTSSYKHKEGCHPARWGTSGDKVGEWRKQGTALLPLICPLSCVHWSQKGGLVKCPAIRVQQLCSAERCTFLLSVPLLQWGKIWGKRCWERGLEGLTG